MPRFSVNWFLYSPVSDSFSAVNKFSSFQVFNFIKACNNFTVNFWNYISIPKHEATANVPATVPPAQPQQHVLAVRVLNRAGMVATAKAVVQ